MEVVRAEAESQKKRKENQFIDNFNIVGSSDGGSFKKIINKNNPTYSCQAKLEMAISSLA